MLLSVNKVLIICDKTYTVKADARQGGVGDETVIISPEIYGRVNQEKFIPIVFEVDESGEAYRPHYLKSRIYFDLSTEDARYRRRGTPCEYSGTLEVVGCVPFERIVEYKMDGDEFYACPHLFCEHKVGESPFSKILYVDEFGSAIPQEQIIQFLDIQSEC